MLQVRTGAAELFEEVLRNDQGGQMEKHIFNHTIRMADRKGFARNWNVKRFRFLYFSKVRSLRFNLQKYQKLLDSVVNKEITYRTLMEMTPQEMRGETTSLEPVMSHKEMIQNVPDGAFTCRRCHSRKTTYYEMQTRSADEPMTVFVTCMNCNNRWKG